MAFIEALFPDTLALGCRGGPTFSTHIVAKQDGAEQRNRNWRSPRWRWEVGQVHRSEAETRTLLAFFRAVAKGKLNTFLFRDPIPTGQAGDDELLGVGDGITRYFPLVKHYAVGSLTFDRLIVYVEPDTLVVALNGTPLAPTAYIFENGIPVVTLVDIPAGGVLVTASYTYLMQVRFDTDRLPIQHVSSNIYSWESIGLWEERVLIPTQGGSEGSSAKVREPDYLMRWELTVGGIPLS